MVGAKKVTDERVVSINPGRTQFPLLFCPPFFQQTPFLLTLPREGGAPVSRAADGSADAGGGATGKEEGTDSAEPRRREACRATRRNKKSERRKPRSNSIVAPDRFAHLLMTTLRIRIKFIVSTLH